MALCWLSSWDCLSRMLLSVLSLLHWFRPSLKAHSLIPVFFLTFPALRRLTYRTPQPQGSCSCFILRTCLLFSYAVVDRVQHLKWIPHAYLFSYYKSVTMKSASVVFFVLFCICIIQFLLSCDAGFVCSMVFIRLFL